MRPKRSRNQKTLATAVLAVAGSFVTPTFAVAQIPAFPGADGAAAYVSGGRGGIVYHVTKLNSAIDDPLRNDVGTIRYGLNNANFSPGVPRTIVFDVAGVFHLGRLPQPTATPPWDPNKNGWDAQSRLTIGGTNITLAGQTAPAAGVIFMGGGLKPQGNNNIIRNITMASGYGVRNWYDPGDPYPPPPSTPGLDPAQIFPDDTVYDGMDIAGTNLMVDHVSTLYATDESISMNEVANNVTVQYSNISQGQNYPQWDAEGGGLSGHAYGSLLEAGSTSAQAAISFHHNLYAHQKARVPQVQSQSGAQAGYYDFRNNVFYNWFGTAGSKSGNTFLNLVNNFYLAGDGGDQPMGGTNPGITTQAGGTGVISATSSIYRNGNLLDSNKDADANDGAPLSAGGAASPLWMNGVATYLGMTDSAAQAFDRVLNYMGARWWTRDLVIDTPDERIVDEARSGTGKIIAWIDDPWNSDPAEGVEWQTLRDVLPQSRDATWDTENDNGYGRGDGMPSWWEIAHGLKPASRDDAGDFDADGYTNLEEYLNEVAQWPAPTALVFTGATNSRYEQTTNWSLNWQPSKYDEAQINAGAVTVNSVGQHARILKVASTAGSSATLTINSGWLDVAEQLQVSNNGQVIINGGALLTPVVQLSDAAQLKLAPGANKTLKTGVITISDTAKLDVSDNQLLITGMSVGDWDGSSYTGVTKLIADGRNGGAWDGAGIITSQTSAQSHEILTTLAVATAAEAGFVGGLFGGYTVAPTDVLVMYTFAGDANLSGDIDADDYFQIDSHYGKTAAASLGYFNGDFDYDGTIDGADYFIIDSNYSAISGANPVQAVPESAVGGVAALAALVLRRRKQVNREGL